MIVRRRSRRSARCPADGKYCCVLMAALVDMLGMSQKVERSCTTSGTWAEEGGKPSYVGASASSDFAMEQGMNCAETACSL